MCCYVIPQGFLLYIVKYSVKHITFYIQVVGCNFTLLHRLRQVLVEFLFLNQDGLRTLISLKCLM